MSILMMGPTGDVFASVGLEAKTVMTKKTLGSIALLLAGTTLLGACSATTTFVDEDDPNEIVGSGTMGRDILTAFGAVPPRTTRYDFKARAPLVLPSSTEQLPEPEQRNQVANTQDWPVDPDEQKNARFREVAAQDAVRDRKDQAYIPASQLLNVQGNKDVEAEIASRRRRVLSKDPQKPLTSAELGGVQALSGSSAGGDLYDSAGNPIRKKLTAPPTTYLEASDQYPVAIPDEKDGKPRKRSGGILSSWMGSSE
ncbi:hypothetical protein HDIA_1079 [Hartmannibacter diazotrophicus]|uniref:Uncharacterized protein n=1 Tax=Hartmannibacter diazotrophicus TaxID=1482074 RepID=A0A2C9D2Y0_9HYPH|nr:hypothetical protein [Hartmannibacter diazotrophicus]SON54620.1 hypothetical protein HDIA_1079 [Hartmannibacter diazotrophicus]